MQFKNQRFGSKNSCGLTIILILKGIIMFQSQRVQAFYWKKTKRNRKWKIPYTLLETQTLSWWTWWAGVHKRKKMAYFMTLVLSKGNFRSVYILSQCIEYWINFQNIKNISLIKKHYLMPLFACFYNRQKSWLFP